MPSGLIHGSRRHTHDAVRRIRSTTGSHRSWTARPTSCGPSSTLLVRRVQEAAPTPEVVDVVDVSRPPSRDSIRTAVRRPSAAHDSERQAASILAADVLDSDDGARRGRVALRHPRTCSSTGRPCTPAASCWWSSAGTTADRLALARLHAGPDAMPAMLEIPPDDPGLMARAARTGATETGSGPAAGQPGDGSDAEGRAAIAVPLRVDGHVVAVLYADAPHAAMLRRLPTSCVSPWPRSSAFWPGTPPMPRVNDRAASARTPAHAVRGGNARGSDKRSSPRYRAAPTMVVPTTCRGDRISSSYPFRGR